MALLFKKISFSIFSECGIIVVSEEVININEEQIEENVEFSDGDYNELLDFETDLSGEVEHCMNLNTRTPIGCFVNNGVDDDVENIIERNHSHQTIMTMVK